MKYTKGKQDMYLERQNSNNLLFSHRKPMAFTPMTN